VYRRLVPLTLAAFVALTLLHAYWPDRASPVLATVTAYVYPGLPRSLHPGSEIALTASVFLKNAVLASVSLVLAWAASFHPTRRIPGWAMTLKLAAGAAGLLFAAAVIYQKGLAAGHAAAVLGEQSGRSLGLILLASQAVHSLLNVAGLALILTAPLFWLVRSAQVTSLRRSAFEAWLQARRLALPAFVLLLLGAVAEVFVSPYATAWLLHQFG